MTTPLVNNVSAKVNDRVAGVARPWPENSAHGDPAPAPSSPPPPPLRHDDALPDAAAVEAAAALRAEADGPPGRHPSRRFGRCLCCRARTAPATSVAGRKVRCGTSWLAGWRSKAVLLIACVIAAERYMVQQRLRDLEIVERWFDSMTDRPDVHTLEHALDQAATAVGSHDPSAPRHLKLAMQRVNTAMETWNVESVDRFARAMTDRTAKAMFFIVDHDPRWTGLLLGFLDGVVHVALTKRIQWWRGYERLDKLRQKIGAADLLQVLMIKHKAKVCIDLQASTPHDREVVTVTKRLLQFVLTLKVHNGDISQKALRALYECGVSVVGVNLPALAGALPMS